MVAERADVRRNNKKNERGQHQEKRINFYVSKFMPSPTFALDNSLQLYHLL